MTLLNFNGSDAAEWRIEKDGVMGGGCSQGFCEVANSTFTFIGESVTEGGRFSSVRDAQQTDLSVAMSIRTYIIDGEDGPF